MKQEEPKKKNNIDNLSRVIEEKKKIPKEVKEKMNAKRFENIIFAVIFLVYLFALNIGMANIPTENYITDLKVFSGMLLVITILLFERAYKKEIGDLWLHGIEIMAIAIFTVYLMYFYFIYYQTFGTIIFSATIVCILYYAIKIIFMKRNMMKQYHKSLVDIGEIVKK